MPEEFLAAVCTSFCTEREEKHGLEKSQSLDAEIRPAGPFIYLTYEAPDLLSCGKIWEEVKALFWDLTLQNWRSPYEPQGRLLQSQYSALWFKLE